MKRLNKYKFGLIVSLILMALGVSCSAEEPASVREEKAEIARAIKLANSENPEDRIQATFIFMGLESGYTPTKIIYKLIRDPEIEVRTYAYITLSIVCAASRGNRFGEGTFGEPSFAAEKVREFSDPLKKIVTKENIERFLYGKMEKSHKLLLIAQAEALNSLYISYPLVSYTFFMHWQNDGPYGDLAMGMVVRREDLDEELDKKAMILVHSLFTPEAINRVIPSLIEGLEKLPADRVRKTITTLWRHPVLGEGRPMNANLKLFLRPELPKLKKKVKCCAKDEHEVEECLRILDMVEE